MTDALGIAPVVERLRRTVESRDWTAANDIVESLSVPDVADALLEFAPFERVLLFRLLPRDTAAATFAYYDRPEQDVILEGLSDQQTRGLLASLAPDDRAELFGELPGAMTQRLLNFLQADDLVEVRQLLGYPEESVGRFATPDYVAIQPEWTVTEALNHVRERGSDSETIDVCYVVNEAWHLLGVCELRRLILADQHVSVGEVMRPAHVQLSAFADREEAVWEMGRHDVIAIPVVDSAGVLIGIVTADDIFDVAEQEATEDSHRAASVMPLRASYRTLSVFQLYGKRVGWLAILLLVNVASSSVIAAYEETLAAIISLAFFIPLLIATAGNTGSQSAMITVRALVTGDVTTKAWAGTLLKELAVGMLLGATLAAGAFGLGWWIGDIRIGIVVGISMAAIVVIANLLGMVLPFALTKLKQDPAVASSPVVTTLADVIGLLIYFGVATFVFRM
ncbi:MAG: magnesium transporter [Coriobacteriia bacterium]